jgi:hypothetical protein
MKQKTLLIYLVAVLLLLIAAYFLLQSIIEQMSKLALG